MKEIRTTLQGNACRDPQILTGGHGFCVQLRVAVNSRYHNPSSGQFEDRKTEYVNVYARNGMGRHVLASVHKGDPLVVHGRVSMSEWTDAEGKGHSALSLQAEAIGHDLTFGSSVYAKDGPSFTGKVPNIDPDTGEVLDEDDADDDADDEDFAALERETDPAPVEPAF